MTQRDTEEYVFFSKDCGLGIVDISDRAVEVMMERGAQKTGLVDYITESWKTKKVFFESKESVEMLTGLVVPNEDRRQSPLLQNTYQYLWQGHEGHQQQM